MEYKIKKIRNPQKPEEQEKFYPVPVYSGTKETSELSKEIAHSTSLTKADVAAVIEELIVVFNNHLLAGEKIKINGIGTFKVSFSGNGSENIDEVSANNIDLSSVKVTFVSDNDLKKSIRSEIKFTKEKNKSQSNI